MANAFRSKKDDSNKPTRYFSNLQEKHIAKEVGGKQVKNSGATPWQKGDVSTDKWLIEAKTCTKSQKQFTIKKEWFEKQKQEALFMGKEYQAMVFNFGPEEPCYYCIDELTFRELLNYQNDGVM